MENASIYSRSPVDMYAAGYLSKLRYPYRLESVKYASPTTAANAEKYILDSAIGDDDYDNEDVVEKAEYLDADVVVPEDIIGDTEQTIENTLDMIELLSDTDVEVVASVQSSTADGFGEAAARVMDRLAPHEDDIFSYAVGGVKDSSTSEQIQAAVAVRNVIGYERSLHLFGGGFTSEWVSQIRETPQLVDSMDTTSPIMCGRNGIVFDGGMKQQKLGNLRGKNSTRRCADVTELSLVNWNYMISEDVRASDAEEVLSS